MKELFDCLIHHHKFDDPLIDDVQVIFINIILANGTVLVACKCISYFINSADYFAIVIHSKKPQCIYLSPIILLC